MLTQIVRQNSNFQYGNYLRIGLLHREPQYCIFVSLGQIKFHLYLENVFCQESYI